MGIPVLILGESGSGKSTSLRNLDPAKVGVLNVAGKPLPFRKSLQAIQKPGIDDIIKVISKNTRRCYVIDDSQYLMAFEMFARAKENGYGKFTDIAVKFQRLLQAIVDNTTPDTVIYLLHHTETTDTGKVKAKTVGKMLDNQLTLEGLFPVVLLCRTDGKAHWFETQSDGFTTVKSPLGMFPDRIDNDLAIVDATIREYWNLNTNTEGAE